MYNDPKQSRKSFQQRSGQYSSNDEIDLVEMLNQIPDDQYIYDPAHNITITNHSHSHSIPSPNSANNNPANSNNNESNENVIILAIKLVFAVVFSQLQKLPISSRIIHQLLILHFILTSIGLAEYLNICPEKIMDKYQYWRFITYPFADTNTFMGLIGVVTLSDIIKRMEYYFGSIWTLYLFLYNWILISIFTFFIQYFCIKLSILPSFLGFKCSCIGLYPMIFNLYIIDSALSFPKQINHIFGIIYLPQIYHPFIYCLLYNVLIRFDIGTIITVLYTFILIYCIPSLSHLSRYRIQKMQKSKLLRCMVNDKLFIPIENIDYDCFVSTGKYITAKCDKNTELSLNQNDGKLSPDQSFHSTLLLQQSMQRASSNNSNTNNNGADDGNNDGSDREDAPFIHSLYGQGHDSDIGNMSHSSHGGGGGGQGVSPAARNNTLHAIQQSEYWKHQSHNNMPIGNVVEMITLTDTDVQEEESPNIDEFDLENVSD